MLHTIDIQNIKATQHVKILCKHYKKYFCKLSDLEKQTLKYKINDLRLMKKCVGFSLT